MICADDELAAPDRKPADVFAAASQKAAYEHPPVFKAEQRKPGAGR
jgi:hypothetical protein